MTADFNVRKIHRAVEKMDSCEYFLEIIIVPLKESIAETNFFYEIDILFLKQLLKETMDDCKISRQNKYISFKEWTTTTTLSVTKTDILLQRKDGRN